MSSLRYIFDVFKGYTKFFPRLTFNYFHFTFALLTREEDEANVVESDIAEQFLERSLFLYF